VNAEGELVHRVLLVVAYRDLVDRYVEACRKAGISLVGIDLEAFALLRALVVPTPTDVRPDAAQVVVSVGHDRSTFAVSDGRACEFARVLEWGGNSLNTALAASLEVQPSDAERLKRHIDLSAMTTSADLSAAQLETATTALRRQVESFARQLVSSLQFYQNQPGSLSIGEIVLTGGTAHMRGFAQELQRLVGVTVRVGDPLMRLRVGKDAVAADEHQIGSFAVAIGLGIED
jgi:type IV pilus assembly protein PilM